MAGPQQTTIAVIPKQGAFLSALLVILVPLLFLPYVSLLFPIRFRLLIFAVPTLSTFVFTSFDVLISNLSCCLTPLFLRGASGFAVSFICVYFSLYPLSLPSLSLSLCLFLLPPEGTDLSQCCQLGELPPPLALNQTDAPRIRKTGANQMSNLN